MQIAMLQQFVKRIKAQEFNDLHLHDIIGMTKVCLKNPAIRQEFIQFFVNSPLPFTLNSFIRADLLREIFNMPS
jgi:hypothetical protein